jgi:pseudoazurin
MVQVTGWGTQLIVIGLTLLWGAANGEAEEHTVRVVSDYDNLRMMFAPKYLEVEPGDGVTWVNEADEEHNVITFPDGYPKGSEAVESPIMTTAGQRWSFRFKQPGTYEYHCIPHLPMGMHGVVIVGRPSANDEFHEPSPSEVRRYRTLLLEWFDSDEFDMLDRDERANAGEDW